MDATSPKLPLAKMLFTFLGILLAGNVLLYLLQSFFPDLDMPGSVGIAFALVASMSSGAVAATALGRPLVAREKLAFAVAATVASLLLTVVLLWAIFAWHGVPLTLANLNLAFTGQTEMDPELAAILPWIGLFAVVVSFLVSYFGVGFGAKNQLKALERKAAKGK